MSDFEKELNERMEAAEKMWAERETNGTAQRGLVTTRGTPVSVDHNITGAYHKPIRSFALGIPNKKQQAEFMRLHPDAEFDPEGRRVIRTSEDRRQILKQEGLVDYDNYCPQLDETCR
jgi:hypothetical protein